MCEVRLRASEALAAERQAKVLDREHEVAEVRAQCEALKRESQDMQRVLDRKAAEWETHERQLGDDIKRAKDETARQESVVRELRDQAAQMRTDQNARYGELLNVQQRLQETELSKQFLTQDRDHVKQLLEDQTRLQTQVSDELVQLRQKNSALEETIRGLET
jgi:chromosome segregation ATPase